MAEDSRRFDPLPDKTLPEDTAPLPAPAAEPPQDVSFKRSVASGVQQVIGTGRSALAAGAAALGLDEYAAEESARAAQDFQRANELAPPLHRIEDVHSPGDMLNWMKGVAGTQLPIMAALLVGGPAALTARGLAARAGVHSAAALSPELAATLGVYTGATALETGSIFQDAQTDPLTRDTTTIGERGRASLAGGALAGSLETLPIVQMGRRLGLGSAARRAVAQPLLTRVGRAAGESALAEGATEAAQTTIERGTLKFLNDNFEVFSPEGRSEILNATAAGMLIGGGLGGLSGVPSPSRLEARLQDMEAADEQRANDSRVAVQRMSTMPGFTEDAAALAGEVDYLPEAQDAAVRFSRQFRANGDVLSPTEQFVWGNLRDGVENTLTKRQMRGITTAMAGLADGTIELTPEIEAQLAAVFPTYSDGQSTLPTIIESLADRRKVQERYLFEGANPNTELFDMSNNDEEAAARADDIASLMTEGENSLTEMVDTQSGEIFQQPDRAATGDVQPFEVAKPGEEILSPLGTLKRQFTSRPDLPTNTEIKAARLTADKRNNVEARLVDLYDAIRTHKQEQGFARDALDAQLDDAARQQYVALKNEDKLTPALHQTMADAMSKGRPRDFLKAFQVVGKRRLTQQSNLGPFDFSNEELAQVEGKAGKPDAQGRREMGENQFVVTDNRHKGAKAISASRLTGLALQKLGIDSATATPEEVYSAFIDGVASLRTPAVYGDEMVSATTRQLGDVLPKINPRTIIHYAPNGTPTRFGEVLDGTPLGRASKRVDQLARDEVDLPKQIAEMEKRKELTEAQSKRLEKLRERLAALPDMQQKARDAYDAAMKKARSEKFAIEWSLSQQERQDPGLEGQSSGQFDDNINDSDEWGIPAINENDVPVMDVGRFDDGPAQQKPTVGVLPSSVINTMFGPIEREVVEDVKKAIKLGQLTDGERRAVRAQAAEQTRKLVEKRDADAYAGEREVPTEMPAHFFTEQVIDEPRVSLATRQNEAEYTAELAKMLGITLRLRHMNFESGDTQYGFSESGSNVITLNAAITDQALRIETIAHEAGHILLDQLSKRVLSSKEIRLAQEMKQAFEGWRAKALGLTVDQAAQTTLAFRTAMNALGGIDRSTKVADMPASEINYILDFHEWFANQMATWATSRAQPRSLIEQFFAGAAKWLREMYDKAVRKGYTPTKAFESFLGEVMQTPVRKRALRERALKEASKKLPKKVRHARRVLMNTGVVNKAPFSDEGLQSTLALMNSDLQPEERRVLTNAFTRGAVRTRMLTILRDSPDLRQRVQADPTQAAAIGYALWSAGMLKVGPQTQDVFTSFADWTRGVMGFVAEHDQATQIMTAMKDGAIAARKAGKGEFELEQVIHTTAIQNAVKNMAKVSKAIMPHMSATFSSASARLRSFNNPYLTELVKQFYVAPGDVGSSQTYFEARTEFIGRWQNIAVRALDELTDAEKAEVEKALQGANVTPSTEAGKRGLANMRRLFRDMFKYAREAGVKLGDQGQVLKNGDVNYYPRVWDMQYLMRNHDTFKKMLLQPKYAKHLEGIGKQRGYYDKFGEFVETAEDLTPEQVVDAIYAALTHNDGYEHSGINYDRASHVPFAMSVNERLLNFLDEAEVEPFVVKNALQDVVLTYITQMVKRAEYTRRFGTTGERIDELLYNAEQNGATQAQIEAAHAFIKAMQGVYGANFDSKVSDFFAKLREKFTEEGTKPDNILKWLEETSGSGINSIMVTWQNIRLLGLATLSSFIDLMGPAMRGGLDVAFTGYKEGFTAFVDEMAGKRRGAKQKNDLVELAEALGLINEQLTNQALAWEYGTLHMSRQARAINDSFFRVIGLTAWTRMTRVMATASAQAWLIRQKTAPVAESARWLDELNLVPDDIVLDKGKLKVLTRAERDAASAEEVARDDRVRAAVVRWVDGAILRPNAAQRPIWASSPAWQLVFHLKGFMYSAHETWLKRVLSEAGHRNIMPLVFFMGMVPIMAASDWLRDRIQNFGSPAKYKQGWGVADHTFNAFQRAGIFGTGQLIFDMQKDVEYNGPMSILDFGSPTSDQIGLLHQMFDDDSAPYQSMDAFYRSLPGQNIWRNWPFIPRPD